MGFSLIASAAILSVTLFMAVEILTSDLLPTIEDVDASYVEMNERFNDQTHTDIMITTITRSLNGANYDYNISVCNTGSVTLATEECTILINGTLYSFSCSEAYIYPERTAYFEIIDVAGSGAKRFKVITPNGIADYYSYIP